MDESKGGVVAQSTAPVTVEDRLSILEKNYQLLSENLTNLQTKIDDLERRLKAKLGSYF